MRTPTPYHSSRQFHIISQSSFKTVENPVKKCIKRVVSVVLLVAQLVSLAGSVIPSAHAAPGEIIFDTSSQGNDMSRIGHWYKAIDGNACRQAIYQPSLKWTTLARLDTRANNPSLQMMAPGKGWINYNQSAAAMMGIPDEAMPQIFKIRDNAPINYAFGRYDPGLMQLRIDVVQLLRKNDGFVYVETRPFTPWHGARHMVSNYNDRKQEFKTASEPACDWGNNPYMGMGNGDGQTKASLAAIFTNSVPPAPGSGPTDPVFYNVSTLAIAQVITAQAARAQRDLSRPALAILATTNLDVRQWTESSGNFFKRSVTQHVQAYAGSDWFVGLPLSQQVNGYNPAYCVLPVPSCDSFDHVIYSGMSWRQWSGGNMPSQQDLIYNYSQTNSGFTLGFFVVVVAIAATVVTAGASAALVVAGAETLGATTIVGTGIAAGAAYGGATLATSPGAKSIVDISNGLGAGVSGPIGTPKAPANGIQAGINQAVQSRVMNAGGMANSTTANSQLYRGSCPENYTKAQCDSAGLASGIIPRADGWREHMDILDMRKREAACMAQYGPNGVQPTTSGNVNKCIAHMLVAPQDQPYGTKPEYSLPTD